MVHLNSILYTPDNNRILYHVVFWGAVAEIEEEKQMKIFNFETTLQSYIKEGSCYNNQTPIIETSYLCYFCVYN